MRTFTLFILLQICLSPVLSAQWEAIDNPAGVTARNIVDLGERLLIATPDGLYQSTDSGENWTRVFTGALERGLVSDLIADGENAIVRVENVETGEYQILTTNNGGAAWRHVTLSPSINSLYRGMIYNGETILYRSSQQTYVSYDGGVNWTSLLNNFPAIPGVFYSKDGTLYVTTTNGKLFRSDDPQNEGWEESPFPLASSSSSVDLMVSGDTLLTAVFNGPVYYSHDGGQSWAEATGVTEFDPNYEGFWQSGDTFYTTNDGDLYHSLDGGITWAATTGNRDYLSDVQPVENGLMLIRSSKVYLSEDEGLTLTEKITGFDGSTIYNWQAQGNGITYFDEDGHLFHATLNDRIFSTDSSLEFQLTRMDEMLAAPDDYVYYVGEYFSTSQTSNVVRISPSGEQTEIYTANNQPWLASDHLEYADEKLFYFGNAGMRAFSADHGETWNQPTDLNTRGYSDYARFGNAVFTITGNLIERKLDGEDEWVDVSSESPMAGIDLGTRSNACRLISTNEALFALLSPGEQESYRIFVSNDGGDTWQETATSLPEIIYPVNNAPPGVKEIVSIGGYHIMAARDVGVAVSADQGLSWTIYNDGLPTDRVEELQIVNGVVVISTYRNGFWQLNPANIQLRGVAGMVYFDENRNGAADADEPGIPNVKMLLENGEDLAFTDNTGNYKMLFRNDGAFGPEIDNPYFVVEPASRNTSDGGPQDFGLQLTEDVNDLKVSLTTDNVHRPGFSNRYYVRYENLAAASGEVSLTVMFDPLLIYDGASLAPDEVVGNTLTFNLGELAPLATGQIVLDFTVPRTAVLGTVISSVATISSAEDTEFAPEDNTSELTDALVGSYDPNDITVDETILAPSMASAGQVLNYRIRFQNTGTYPAETVVVRNDIDPGLLLGSIKDIATSHSYEIEVENDRTLAFVFNNIMLADSSRDEAASHGYITYSILVDEDVAVGDSILNQAAIYFDYNDPIITNEVATVIEIPIATRDPAVQLAGLLYPNPIRRGESLSFRIDSPAGTLTVCDQLGRRVKHLSVFHPNTQQLTTRDWEPGVYFINFASSAGRAGMKVIVK
ncbi:T9SS type A sorting domain-containing protein [Neolewinella aurantiaca]|uniref:T9SS type A sorting domain-containing protein n=1 Tax=Neolewinella aurantiaca TaxID=2602767 RepID=A0A5C7FCC3_9BACT|nr:YCF48-related protein [Neolewinella aurantiaca]TXF88307.1 T9SS type A sorting domain-containing protein [Neolewinella aurantiaca]